jgi:hypothetical protein
MSSKKPGAKSKKAAAAGPIPPYGPPIRDAIARGDLKEMKALAASTKKYLANLEKAVKSLEARIEKLEG